MTHTIPDLEPSFFIGKNDPDTISFGSGQPDLPPPKQVYEILPKYKDFKYGLIQGEENLRSALSEQYPGSTMDSFVITNGASEALDLSLRVLSSLDTGHKNCVLVTKPYYYSYPRMVAFAGMEPKYLELKEGRIDLDDFKKKVSDCKVVIINSPSNPTGRIESLETLKEIERIAEDKGFYIISDEVYKDLIYERENYIIKGSRVITVNSFSKTFAMCGFRVGYLWSRDQPFVDKVIEMKTHTSMNTGILSQEMAFEATKVPRSFIDGQLKIWKERRDTIYEGLIELGFELWKPEGAFYVLPKLIDPKPFVWNLFKKHKVITYPGDWFGADDRIRLSYALSKEKIKRGLEIIGDFIKN